jgi:hypothetical protein
MLKQLQYGMATFLNALTSRKNETALRGFSLIEVAFLVMIMTVIILPVVGSMNANQRDGQPTLSETIERQQSIEQGVRSLMQRAINGKIVIQPIENPTEDFKRIDNGSGTLYTLSNLYAPTNLSREAQEGLFLFKVPIGVQNTNTKPLFQFRWTLKDASFEAPIDPLTGLATTSVSTTPDGLKKVDLVLEVFPATATATEITGGASQPIVIQHGTTFYSQTTIASSSQPTSASANTTGLIINIDLNKSGCLKRKLEKLTWANKWRRLPFYNPRGLPQDNCGEDTSMENTEGIKLWYNRDYANRNNTAPAYASLKYLQAIDVGMQTMEQLDPTALMEVALNNSAEAYTFMDKLPSLPNTTTHYNDDHNLLPESYAYSATARAIQALKEGNYTKGLIIHVITSNLDSENQTINLNNANGIPLTQKLGVFTNPDPSALDTNTNDLLNLAVDYKVTTNNNGEALAIKHYVLLHKGLDHNTGEYFIEIANQTGGKVYYTAKNHEYLVTEFKKVLEDSRENQDKKKNKSKTYRHSMR